MKHNVIICLLILSSFSRAEDRSLQDVCEYVEATYKHTFEIKPKKEDLHGFEKLLDRITIEPTSGSSPTSFIVSGRVVSGNTGCPLERIPVYVGTEGFEPRQAALTNVDGEFKFRLWIKGDHRDSEIQIPKDFSGYLYLPGLFSSGGRDGTIVIGQPCPKSLESKAEYRRYSLKRLLELSKAAKP